MSHEALPIDRVRFTEALQSLPIDALHSKVAELRNSIQHLRFSNEQMVPFADEGDQDCKDAMFENLIVIGRMNERIELLREEVEKRGMRWSEAEVEDRETRLVNGTAAETQTSSAQTQQPSGTLTDEQLRARLEERLGTQDTADDEGEEGVHL